MRQYVLEAYVRTVLTLGEEMAESRVNATGEGTWHYHRNAYVTEDKVTVNSTNGHDLHKLHETNQSSESDEDHAGREF
ncbi:MAG: hypothetical protein LBT40_09440 [Deltaproteobacteria bacterium]|jgi:hypothetical protein|nr:hypothetical protein [Deltaproteobacteria bacterium]